MLRRSPIANDTSSLCRVEACAPVIVFVLVGCPAAGACLQSQKRADLPQRFELQQWRDQ